MDNSTWIFKTHKCCACGKKIKDTETSHVNLVQLPYRATWKYPTYGNYLQNTSGIAGAVVCDPCLENKVPVKWAIEYQGKKLNRIVYHEVETLEMIEQQLDTPGYDPDYDVFE